jgi:hypothetical protein
VTAAWAAQGLTRDLQAQLHAVQDIAESLQQAQPADVAAEMRRQLGELQTEICQAWATSARVSIFFPWQLAGAGMFQLCILLAAQGRGACATCCCGAHAHGSGLMLAVAAYLAASKQLSIPHLSRSRL